MKDFNRIVFLNTAHNGDVYFSKEFIRNFVVNNPDINFSVATKCSKAIFRDLAIDVIDFDSSFLDEKLYLTKSTLYINTWAGVTGFNCTNLSEQKEYYKNLALKINNKFNKKIVFNEMSFVDCVPRLDLCVDTQYIDRVMSQLNSKRIKLFYYNVNSRSGQCLNYDHDCIISDLLHNFPDYYILVAKQTECIADNLVDLSKFNIDESMEYDENLMYYGLIACHCDIIVMKDCGACFFAFNSEYMKRTSKQHIVMVRSDKTTVVEQFILPTTTLSYCKPRGNLVTEILNCLKLNS